MRSSRGRGGGQVGGGGSGRPAVDTRALLLPSVCLLFLLLLLLPHLLLLLRRLRRRRRRRRRGPRSGAVIMFARFDASKSTKGASKLRRDLINAEIANLRDLLPLPPSTRQRLSQLQLMALVCVYVRKANYFQQVFKRPDVAAAAVQHLTTPNIGFSKALCGFLMMMTQNGKLLYISDNAAEYLGHSMEDLLIHGDSVYDIIDKQDHQAIQAELVRAAPAPPHATPAAATAHAEDERIFLCRMNVSRNARRQMRFGDQKVVLVQGHYLSFLPLCSRNEPVFLATCTPVAMPETRECVVQGATHVFTSIHSMDMKFIHVDKNGEFHLGYPRADLQGASWYQLLHWDSMREAQAKHRLITQSDQDRSCILLVRLQRGSGDWLWVHCVLQVKDNMESSQQPVIVCTNQVLSDKEAGVMRANSWLYHYYMVQSKLQYGLPYDAHAASRMVAASYYPPAAPPPPPPPPSMAPYQQHEGGGTGAGGAPPPPHHPAYHQQHQQQPPPHTHLRTVPEPVDYSRHSPPPPPPPPPPAQHRRSASPARRRPASPVATEVLLVDAERGPGVAVAALNAAPTSSGRPPPRLLVKAAALEPSDLMEQWNPSPPWSDTALQKVPDVVQQDLSPYVTSTPPTPSATPGTQHAFTFDWTAPEQFVPSVAAFACAPPPDHDDDAASAWAPEQRTFHLQAPPPPRTGRPRKQGAPPPSGQEGGEEGPSP